MAGPRPMIVFRERRDRIAIPQPGLAGAGLQSLHPDYSRAQRFEVEEEKMGRMSGGQWDTATASAHQHQHLHHHNPHQHQQQQALASAVRRQRLNSGAHPHLTTSLIHGPGPGQPTDWVVSARLDRNLLLDEASRMRLSVGLSRELPRDILTGLRLKEERLEIRKNEFLKTTGRGWQSSHTDMVEEARDRVEMSRAYQHSTPTLQFEHSSRGRGITFGWEDGGNSDLVACYGARSSSRDLEKVHPAIPPGFQQDILSRKRTREEEVDFDRERLQRHRKLSGIDSPPGPIQLQAISREESHDQSKGEYRRLRVDEDDHEEGQVTPPPPIIPVKSQHGGECKKQLYNQEQEMIVCSRPEVSTKGGCNSPRFQNGFALPVFQQSPPESRSKCRPSTMRDNGGVLIDQFDSVVSRERERLPSPRFKDNERMLTRVEGMVGGVESFSLFSSDLSDMRRRVTKESESHTRPVNSKAAERGHDGFKRRHATPQRVSRSPHKSRRSTVGAGMLDSFWMAKFSKDPGDRSYNDVKRRTSRTAKDSRHIKEMTISVQKHGQRIVKVEEYKPRDTGIRAHSQINKEPRVSHRGGVSNRDASETTYNFSTERSRLNFIKRKDSEARLPSGSHNKILRSKPSDLGISHPEHRQRSASQEHGLPCSQHIKKELLSGTDKCETESHRHHSIFSRFAGFKPETTSTSLTTMVEKDSCLPIANDKISLASSSKKSPSSRVKISASNNVSEDITDFHGFTVPTRDNEVSPVVSKNGLISMNGNNSFIERISSRQLGQRDRQAIDSLKVKIPDVSKQEESVSQLELESVVSKFPQFSRKVFSPPSEEGQDGLQRDLTHLEFSLHETDLSKFHSEGLALPTVDLKVPLHANASDMGYAEVPEQLSGNGSKSLPKVISTGHKKDQVLKKIFVNADLFIQDNSSIPLGGTNAVAGEKSSQEMFEGRTFAEWMLGVPGCRQEMQTLNSMGKFFGNTPSPTDQEINLPLSNLEEKNLRIIRSPELVQTVSQSVGTGSTFYSCFPLSTQPSICDLNPGELKQIIPPQVSDAPSAVVRYRNSDSLSVISQLKGDEESKRGMLMVPIPTCNSSTPKEVRLFGANLNAPMVEREDLTPKAPKIVDQDLTPSGLPAFEDAHISVCTEKVSPLSTPIELEKDDVPPVPLTDDEQVVHLKETVKSQEKTLIHHEEPKELMSLAPDTCVAQVQFEVPSIPQEQYLPFTNLQKIVSTAQGQPANSPHSTGAHTWRRGTSSNSPANSASITFRGAGAFSGLSNPAGRARGQGAAYVRKGNSLVRAPGAVPVFQSANDVKVITNAISGRVRPPVRQHPMVKALPFRNTFIANAAKSKNFYPTHRKYIAPPTENNGVLTPSIRSSNPTNIPHNSSDPGMSAPPSLARPKSPAQVPLKVTSPGVPSTLFIAQVEQQAACPSLELPIMDGADENLSEVGTCRIVNDTSPATQSTSVMSAASNPGGAVVQKPVVGNRLYVRRNANQLVVAPSQSVDLLPTETQSSHTCNTGLMSGQYIKSKINQLVRSNTGKGSSIWNFVQDILGSGPSPDITDEHGGGNALVPKKMRRGRVLRQKKGPTRRSSWVWTLSGAAVGSASGFTSQSLRTGPLLFPWKKQNSLRTPRKSQRLRPFPEGKKGSLLSLMSKRLRRVRPVQPVYTRSADGFSLHRSGVMSLGGGNLKWTKSLEKRAKQASEAATKAVAEAERRKREKKEAVVEASAKVKAERKAARKAARGDGERVVWVGLVRYKMDVASNTLQRIPDSNGTRGDTETSAPTGLAITSPLLTPRRSTIGGTVYLRVGNGNQLVRDPKAASRALASEKIRWSLHNARSRGAKKQQYCQFFTKFGKCNKENGKCSYIHDPDKVAVCTKFLKGNCTDGQCLLTHKVIPERMPDCSFFLEGLCTNENCPYRHVNVNPKAPYCEGFLRGYCKDGDKCNKKHTYVCSVYAETGECLDRSICKFHHPKKKEKKPSAQIDGRKIGTKRKRRYFSSIGPDFIGKKLGGEDTILVDDSDAPNDGSMDFISLSNISESDEDPKVSNALSQPCSRPGLLLTMKEGELAENVEQWIKPTFLLQMTTAAPAAH